MWWIVAYLLERAVYYGLVFRLPSFLSAQHGTWFAGVATNLVQLLIFLLPSVQIRLWPLSVRRSVALGALCLCAAAFASWRGQSIPMAALLTAGTCFCRPLMPGSALAASQFLPVGIAMVILANLGGGVGLALTIFVRDPELIQSALCFAVAWLVVLSDFPARRTMVTDSCPAGQKLWLLLPGFTFLNAQAGTTVLVELSRRPLFFLGVPCSAQVAALWFTAAAALSIPLCRPLLKRAPVLSASFGVCLCGLAFALIAAVWSTASVMTFFLLSGVAEVLVLPATYREAVSEASDAHRASVDWFALQGVGFGASILASVLFSRLAPAHYFGLVGLSAVPSVWIFHRMRKVS